MVMVTAGLNCTADSLETMKLTPREKAVDSACCTMFNYSHGSLLISIKMVLMRTKVHIMFMGKMSRALWTGLVAFIDIMSLILTIWGTLCDCMLHLPIVLS